MAAIAIEDMHRSLRSSARCIKSIGRAHQQQSIEIIKICRSFITRAVSVEYSGVHEKALSRTVEAVENAVAAAATTGGHCSKDTDSKISSAEEKLCEYVETCNSSTMSYYDDEMAGNHDTQIKIKKLLEDARRHDEQSMNKFRSISQRAKRILPRTKATTKYDLVFLQMFISGIKTDYRIPMVFDRDASLEQILWIITCRPKLPEPLRFTLDRNPHFYRALHETPSLYGHDFALKALTATSFKETSSEKLYIILNGKSHIFFDATEAWKNLLVLFANFQANGNSLLISKRTCFAMLGRIYRLASPLPSNHRAFASVSPSSQINPNTVGPFQVFDRNAKRLQKDRAALREGGQRSRTVDYVRDEVADRMIERFTDVKRKFSSILDLGSGPGHFSKLLESGQTGRVTMLDMSSKTLNRDPSSEFEVPVERLQVDEEHLLETIPRNSQEAIVSCLSLHWVNDLPGRCLGVLIQIREALKPDGVFIGAIFGGDTLFELRTALQLAEVDREGGISPHVSPMANPRDMSNLMSRAGFTLLTVDVDEVITGYPSMWELMEDLRDMGESNAVIGRRNFIPRDTLVAASAIYKELHGKDDGSIPATFQVIYMIGWKPAPDQPKPLERGTGKTNLKEIL
ncbi:hypothetical protein EW146_g4046 [Bondarzewia mesenterica]|uniref:Methyltransferase type 11 domain-containing protein n=1 Tax=Bondarzewia mesenterica TaxID=1095465 RepID=A0A4S4M1J4_9AGAM|nr:hypothetical protein EW146_g4046 [Bondarzewia mesenterica]